eukprot:3349007-Pyramimonas_sp.AAC.1
MPCVCTSAAPCMQRVCTPAAPHVHIGCPVYAPRVHTGFPAYAPRVPIGCPASYAPRAHTAGCPSVYPTCVCAHRQPRVCTSAAP